MNRTKKLVTNVGFSLILQVATLLVGFVSPRIMISAYGSEANGLIGSVNQFIHYFRLVDAGISTSMIYALYQPLAEGDTRKINQVVSTAKWSYLNAGKCFVVMTLCLAVSSPLFLETTALPPVLVGVLVLLLAVDGGTLYFVFSKYWTFLLADQKAYVVSCASLAQLLLQLYLVLTFADPSLNLVLFFGLSLAPLLLRSSLLLIYCKIHYPTLDFSLEVEGNLLHKRKDACIHQILGTVNTGLPIVMLTVCLKDFRLVSVYTVFHIVITGIQGLLQSFTTPLTVTFGDMLTRKEEDTLKQSHRNFEFIFYGLISLVYSITFVTIMPFIRIYTQDIQDNQYDLPLFGFLCVMNSLVSMIGIPQSMLVTSAGHFKETKGILLGQVMVTLLVNHCLLEEYGIYGVMTATLLGSVYACLRWFSYTPKRILHTGVGLSFLRLCRLFLNIVLITVPTTLVTSFWKQPSDVVEWIFYASVVGIYALLVVGSMHLLLEKSTCVALTSKIKSRMKRG